MNIHLIAAGKYKNRENWPSIWEQCYQSIEKLGYPIKIWDNQEIDNELISDDQEFYNEYLNKLDPIYKYDYVRYIILERYGGIYLDMDVEIKINFIPLLNPDKIYIAEGEFNCIVNNHIMISPNTTTFATHVFWHNIRQYLKYRLISQFNKCKTSEYYTIETVGPIGLSYVLTKEKYPYTPLSRYHFGSKITDLQFCIHHCTHKWTEEKEPPYK